LAATALLFFCYHLEWNPSLIRIAAALQDLHVLDEVLEVDLT
jgi:hypothetical protein